MNPTTPANQVPTPPQQTLQPPVKSRRDVRVTIGIILMAAPVVIVIVLAIIYAILSKTALGSDPSAAGIFLPLIGLIGITIVLGFPAFITGIILTIIGTSAKK